MVAKPQKELIQAVTVQSIRHGAKITLVRIDNHRRWAKCVVSLVVGAEVTVQDLKGREYVFNARTGKQLNRHPVWMFSNSDMTRYVRGRAHSFGARLPYGTRKAS